MNTRILRAGICALLYAALLSACGMPPIPPPAGSTITRAVGDGPSNNRVIETPGPEIQDPGARIEAKKTTTSLEGVAPQPAQDEEQVQAVQAAHTPSAVPQQAHSLEDSIAKVSPGVKQGDPPAALSEPGEDVEPVEPAPQPEATRGTSSTAQTTGGDLEDCAETGPGRQKVRVVNKTGEGAVLYLFGPENYACTIEPGVQRIYIQGGVYNLSSLMCGGVLYELGRNVVNPTWFITLRCP